MTNTKKSIITLVAWVIIMIGIVVYKYITGDINLEVEDLRYYVTLLSLFLLISGIFAGIAVKQKEGKLAGSLLTINIGFFVVTFYLGVISRLLQVSLFG